jgi:hypothetical protein
MRTSEGGPWPLAEWPRWTAVGCDAAGGSVTRRGRRGQDETGWRSHAVDVIEQAAYAGPRPLYAVKRSVRYNSSAIRRIFVASCGA